ncbi:MAG: prepilin-type N-terminal cleavage/methylation domain-containing protein [Gemmataceae bacterium]
MISNNQQRPPTKTSPLVRRGYTLIELLVVVALVLTLLGLTVLFLPSYSSQERIASGAGQLQKLLMVAKQRALLDRAPRGLRLLPDNPSQPRYYSTMVLIGQPDDLSGGLVKTKLDSNNQPTLLDYRPATEAESVDYPNINREIDAALVEVGDWIEVNGSGLMRRIVGVNGSALQLQSQLPTEIKEPTPNFRIVRKPRPLGEPPITLPTDVVVDTINPIQDSPLDPNMTSSLVPLGTGGVIDIMFSPSGAVMGNPSTDWYVFWVREQTGTSPYDGAPTLMVLNTRSGETSNVEVETGARVQGKSGNPYIYVR